MTPNPISVTFDIGEGLMVTIETGKLARQADGAVTVRLGDCVILATVVANKEIKEATVTPINTGESLFGLEEGFRPLIENNAVDIRSEEHTSELQSLRHLV